MLLTAAAWGFTLARWMSLWHSTPLTPLAARSRGAAPGFAEAVVKVGRF